MEAEKVARCSSSTRSPPPTRLCARPPNFAGGTRGHQKVIHGAGAQACLVQAPTEHLEQQLSAGETGVPLCGAPSSAQKPKARANLTQSAVVPSGVGTDPQGRWP